MKNVKLVNPDFKGYVKRIRNACRGILIKGDAILLVYEQRYDKYMIPGGGVESGESFFDCIKREIKEETGIICAPKSYYLEIEELFDNMRHINHYFVCEVLEETNQISLTAAEERSCFSTLWVPLKDAYQIFSKYEDFKDKDPQRFGLYRREFTALDTYLNK